MFWDYSCSPRSFSYKQEKQVANCTWLKCPFSAPALAERPIDANLMRQNSLINATETRMHREALQVYTNGSVLNAD